MSNKITESQIENFAISLLEKKGYQYFYGPEIAPDSENSQGENSAGFVREGFEEVVLVSVLKKAIERINPQIPSAAREDALRQVLRIASPDLIAANEEFHRMLTNGVKVSPPSSCKI